MQEKKSYWWIIAGTCLAAEALAAQACTVTTSSDGTGVQAGGSAGTAGAGTAGAGTAGAGTAGAGTAGAGTAGAGTAGAGTAGAGTAGTAGTAGGTGTPFQCDMGQGNPVGTPSGCGVLTAAGDACSTCIAGACCTEYGQCYATSPGNQCGWGGPDSAPGSSEFVCFITCMRNTAADAGVGDPATCANMCATKHDSSGAACAMSDIGAQTNALISCMSDNNCNTPCGF